MDKCEYCNPPLKIYPATCMATETRELRSGSPWVCTRPKGHEGEHVACGGYEAHAMHKWPASTESSDDA